VYRLGPVYLSAKDDCLFDLLRVPSILDVHGCHLFKLRYLRFPSESAPEA
jgi:hypothetical protein